MLRIEKAKKVLLSKEKEYATKENRYHNFIESARIYGDCVKKTFFFFSLKHLTSIVDMLKENVSYNKEMVDEKIGDMFNYCVLLNSYVNKVPLEETLNNIESRFKDEPIGLHPEVIITDLEYSFRDSLSEKYFNDDFIFALLEAEECLNETK